MTATGGHSDSMPLDELRRLKTEDYGVTVDRVRPKMMREWNHGTDTQRGSWRDHGGPGGYVDHLRAQIKTNGITEPIEIGHRPDGRATIYDGTHRALIAHELGIDPVPVKHFQMVRGQHYGKLAVQEPPEGLAFQHREEETGGSKFPTKIHLDAVHPEHGVMGTLRYYPPKRSNGRILVDKLEVNPEHQRRGVGSALMDEMQRRHPNASIDHGSRTNDGRAWWSGYAGDKDVRRGRTASAPGASRKDVADRVLGDSVLSRQSDLLSSELIGGAGLYAAGLRHGPNRQVTHDDGRAIAPDDELTLYHETSAERAAHLRQHGTSQSKPVGARTVDNDYEPGRGMGKGLYLMHSPHAAGGVFGDTVLPVRVRAGDLAVPPERAHRIPHGMTPLRSLMIGDGYTEAELPHHAFGEPIRRQASTRQGDRSTCPCGTPVEFDSIDGWQHRDGSVSHDGDFYGKSVSDLMRTSVLGPITPASGTIAGSHLPYDATYQAAGETHYLHREPRGVHARTGEGRLSGFLNWDSQGQVGSVQVQPEYRRHGLASALWEHAKVAEPDLHHSTTLSSDGAAWARHTSAGQRNWGTFWHGTPSGDLRGGAYGLHVGSQEAARQALESRIGFRADGKDWDGTQEYGKTLLAGRSNLLGRERGQNLLTGHNARGLPEHDHYPHERAEKPKFGSGDEVQPHHRPALFPVRITGEMSNTPESAHDDFKANGLMKGQITRGNARRGYFYRNQGEDDGSVSAVLPGPGHVERVDHHTGARFVPDKRVFTHTDGLDHRLFDGEHLRPEVRSYVLGTITTWWAGEYRDWSKWARVYFAGSEASEWTSQTLEGNDDFDVLVGVDYDGCRTANPQLAGLSNQQITDEMNAGFRSHNGPVMITVDGILTGPWDRTSFVNVDSHDIRRIKPYAAYDVGADAWVVKPPHLPHWSLSELPKPVQLVLRAADSYARHVLKLPEPERTQQGAALFEAWHSDRSRAFSDRGEGWWDIANLREKWGSQAGWWDELVACKRRADQGLDKAPEGWSNTPTGYFAVFTGQQRQCPCGKMARFHREDRWRHLDGSASHDDGESVSDKMCCSACSGTGEQGTGHECYQCDGTGLRSEQDPTIDNANPENGLPVGRDDSKGIKPVLAKLPKTQKCEYCKQQATKRVIWAEGMGYIPVCDRHEPRAKDHVGEDYCNTKLIPKTATGALVLHLCTEGTPAHRIASMAGDPDQLMPHQAAVYRAQSAMTNSGKNLHPYLNHLHAQDMCRAVLSEQGHPHGDKLLVTHANHGRSYVKYDSDNSWPRIGLAPNHLHSHAVFHELAHILTNGDHESTSDEEAHGPAFVHTFRHLLDSYSSSAARQVFDEHYRPPSTHEPRMGSWPQVVREESQIRPISDFSDDKIRAGDHSSWSSFHRLVDRGGSGRQRVDEIKRTLQSGSPLHRPIEVQQQPDGSEHVGDGHHRIRALQELGWTKIPVTVKHMAHTGSQSQSATLYHWAPQAAREDIAEHGLDHRRAPGFDPAAQGPRGVFMHHSEDLARDWVPDIERTHDLYEVKASGLKLHPDPYDTGDASYTEHPVPPDRLRRLTSARRSPHHGEGPWFHGSNADLKPGDTLKPGDAVGEKSHGRYSDGIKVWISNDVGRASAYGHRTYEVEPHSRPRSPYANHDEHHTTGATVLREVDHRGQPIQVTSMMEAPKEGPLPHSPGQVFYRLHPKKRGWSQENASSQPFGGGGPYGDEGEPLPREHGYSAFDNPHDLRRYLNGMDWHRKMPRLPRTQEDREEGRDGRVDPHQVRVVQFRGEVVGHGHDGEHLVRPHARADRQEMDYETFHHRLNQTSHPDVPYHWHKAPYEHTPEWAEGNGHDCDPGGQGSCHNDYSQDAHEEGLQPIHHWASKVGQVWITPQLVMGSAAGLNHARAVNSASEARSAISEGLTAVLPAGSWFIARQALQALGMPLLDVTQRLRQLGAPA